MRADAFRFVQRRLADVQFGGYFPVVSCDGQSVVSTDKRLSDQVEAALLWIDKKQAHAAAFAISALDNLYDRETRGFVELTDRYWNPHGAGSARSLHVQLDAARAYARYATEIGGKVYLDRALEVLRNVATLATEGRLASAYNSDWSVPLDGTISIALQISATNFAAVLVRLGVHNHVDALAALVSGLTNRIESCDSLFGTSELRKCETCAKIALALANWANAVSDQSLLVTVRSFLTETITAFRDDRYGGFWDRISPQGSASVGWDIAYVDGESPFPVKRALDAALLLRAARECGCADHAIEQELESAIDHYKDSHAGGHFIGMGYFWSTPKDPTVPFARQMWVSRKHAGVFSIGNLTYLPLHLKTLETQVACGHVLSEGAARISPGRSETAGWLVDSPLIGDFRDAYTHAAPHLPVDVERYLGWLRRTRPSDSGPYGLTAEIAPLGFRADRSWQVFSTLHVLADLRALQVPASAQASISECIRDCQNPDGGFSERPGQLSDIFATYCATVSLQLLYSEPINPHACIHYVNRCQNSDGGYGNVPGMRSDIWHTNLAVLALEMLGGKSMRCEDTFGFVLSCRNPDGGFGNRPGLPADTFSVYRAVSTFTGLGKRLIAERETTEWLRKLQDPTGHFIYRPGQARSLVGTYMAIAALYLMDAAPKYVDEAKAWIASHQKRDGGFGPLGTTSATTDEGFVCIQSLLILDQALSRLWVAMVN